MKLDFDDFKSVDETEILAKLRSAYPLMSMWQLERLLLHIKDQSTPESDIQAAILATPDKVHGMYRDEDEGVYIVFETDGETITEIKTFPPTGLADAKAFMQEHELPLSSFQRRIWDL